MLESRLGSGMVQKISNLLRFENGFEIRNLHHFVSKEDSGNVVGDFFAHKVMQIPNLETVFESEQI